MIDLFCSPSPARYGFAFVTRRSASLLVRRRVSKYSQREIPENNKYKKALQAECFFLFMVDPYEESHPLALAKQEVYIYD